MGKKIESKLSIGSHLMFTFSFILNIANNLYMNYVVTQNYAVF